MLSLHFVGKCVCERKSTTFTAGVSVYLHSAHYNEIKLQLTYTNVTSSLDEVSYKQINNI